MRVFGQTTELKNALLEGTGIDPNELPGVTEGIELWQFIRQIENMGRLVPTWGLELDSVAYASAHGALGVAIASAPTLADALGILERYAYLRAPYFRLVSAQDAQMLNLRVVETVELPTESRYPLLESLLLSIQALVETSLGRPMVEARLDIAGPGDPPNAARYARCFHPQVHLRQVSFAIKLPVAWMTLPCPLGDSVLHNTALSDLEATERRFHGDDFIVQKVEQLVAESGDQPFSLAEAAKHLHVSRRTLIRRLQDQDVSFRALVRNHRRRAASRLLSDETLTITEVAFRLGYSDPTNFTRACRRWFRMSPSSYRRQITRGNAPVG